MLKSCHRPLITLVLALVATGVFSTLCSAHPTGTLQGNPATRAMQNVKPMPVALSGEPDQPLAPPPRQQNGIQDPLAPEVQAAGAVHTIRWIGMIWAYWFGRLVL